MKNKKIYIATIVVLLFIQYSTYAQHAAAKTYILCSGKWTDKAVWNNDYPGTTIKANDVVIIIGDVIVNVNIIIEGTLQIEKGAKLIGIKDLSISRTGKLINNGSTAMRCITNEGYISNNLLLEGISELANYGNIENNSLAISGTDFPNIGGMANGKAGIYIANSSVLVSPASEFGCNTQMLCIN